MMKTTILDKIVAHKKEEVAERKKKRRPSESEKDLYHQANPISLKHNLPKEHAFLIAEFKRKSPSKGLINPHAKVDDVVRQYQNGGASAISVLTDNAFFMGSDDDLKEARKHTDLPLLRKDFIIDEFQIYESKYLGANLILLIATILSNEMIATFTELAHSIGLEVLCEVYDEKEIERIPATVDFVGVNNRNLHSFEVNINHAQLLIDKLPRSAIPISESAISSKAEASALVHAGFRGLLVGEFLMRSAHVEEQVKHLLIPFI